MAAGWSVPRPVSAPCSTVCWPQRLHVQHGGEQAKREVMVHAFFQGPDPLLMFIVLVIGLCCLLPCKALWPSKAPRDESECVMTSCNLYYAQLPSSAFALTVCSSRAFQRGLSSAMIGHCCGNCGLQTTPRRAPHTLCCCYGQVSLLLNANLFCFCRLPQTILQI